MGSVCVCVCVGGKNAFLGCFLFYELFSNFWGQTSCSSALLPCLPQSCDLNNESAVFCLLAVLPCATQLHTQSAWITRRCHKGAFTAQRRRAVDFSFSDGFFEQCHLDGITGAGGGGGFRISPGVAASSCVERFDAACRVRCQLTIGLLSGREKEIYSP